MSGSHSSFFAAQNVQDPGKITLPHLGPKNKRQAPVQLSSNGWNVTHASAVVPPETALPRGAEEQNHDATAQIRLPPVADLIAEVDAHIARQLQRTIPVSTPSFPRTPKPNRLPRIVINCQSLLTPNFPGFSLYELRNWAKIRPAFNILAGITESEVKRRLASVHPPVMIGFYLAGYDHLNIGLPINRHHECRSVADFVFHVGVICEKFVTRHCNDYRGPRGVRVGPGYAPFECVRMIRIVQVTDNYWIGVLAAFSRLKPIARP